MAFRDKDPAIQAFMDANALKLYGRTVSDVLQSGDCVVCGFPADEFDDDISKAEYEISGMCQNCQNDFFPSEE